MTKYDNQGRNLEATKKHFDMLARLRQEGEEESHKRYLETVAKFPIPDWTTFEGVLCLRAGKSRFVGAPRNGKKTAASYDIIDIQNREHVTTLPRSEIASWLWRASQSE